MRAALYARVSTSGNGQDPEVQLRELREYCDRRGWTIAGEYTDVVSPITWSARVMGRFFSTTLRP